MGFFDLNIPYHESDRHATDKPSLKRRRLKLALKAMELGYTGVAYNRTLKGVMSESDRSSTPFFPLSKLTPSSSSFFAAVKFHRELLNVAVSSPFRQYTRLTVIVDTSSQASALNAGNPVIKSYDIVAIRPMNQNAFDQACQTAEVDMIAIDFSDKLAFRLKQPMVKAAIKRGVYFEITYSGLVADAQTRRQMISNCKLLVDWTRGKNLIISSSAPSVAELRGPQDVANLFSLLGLSSERAKAAVSKNCRSLLTNALRKKHFHKETVKVEQVPSGGQQSPLDDWLKWDPISSGEADLLLDDMEKSFSISNTQTETAKTINFMSSVNDLPAHGLQIKDLISVAKEALEPIETNNSEPAAMEIETAVEACQDSKMSLDFFVSKEIVALELLPVNDLEANLVASEIRSSSQTETPVAEIHVSEELSNTVNESSFSAFTLEESNVESRCGVGVSCAEEDVPVDMVPNKIDSDAPGQDEYCEMTDNPVKLCDGVPVEGLLNLETDLKEPISNDVRKQIDPVLNNRGLDNSQEGARRHQSAYDFRKSAKEIAGRPRRRLGALGAQAPPRPRLGARHWKREKKTKPTSASFLVSVQASFESQAF
ncbi:ribonuclease p protein subunit p30 [Phtheirospermum japonicum]|uniref:Ribonuclease p protein subunit p30 n=1 Tax=Phtheirospermum japonicum TaxID=374723 RepID=A0A830C2I7_9LAMI|nr:ribonuclease p protein subunit p30 [Phtheirospermum japonicum]